MEQGLCAAMSRRANENVGRVLYDGDCVGSCASVLLCLSPALGTTAFSTRTKAVFLCTISPLTLPDGRIVKPVGT